jgi:3-oxoacyl-[acyl-carrier-protein] synthase-3
MSLTLSSPGQVRKPRRHPEGREGGTGGVPVQIAGIGHALPLRVETNEELARRLDWPASSIEARTGVRERRVSEEPWELLAARAARAALGDGPPPDLVINASLTPRQLIPDSSVFLHRELGLRGVPSFSVHATCLSFLVGLQVASSLLASGTHRRVLIVSCEMGSISRNFAEPESASLVGDGAAAALVVPSPTGSRSALLGLRMATWSEAADLAQIRGFGTRCHPSGAGTVREDNLFSMNGPAIYKFTVRRAAALVLGLLRELGVPPDAVDLVVPHQASGPALDAIPRFGFPPARIHRVVQKYGNCIAASLPMALSDAVEQRRIQRNDTVLLLGTGAGLSVAAALLRW